MAAHAVDDGMCICLRLPWREGSVAVVVPLSLSFDMQQAGMVYGVGAVVQMFGTGLHDVLWGAYGILRFGTSYGSCYGCLIC